MKRILIADDDSVILAACLETVVKDGRFQIETAVNPELCLAQIRSTRFDAVVLDLSFTANNTEGLKLITQIKSCLPNCSIIVLSGLDDTKTMLDAVDRGAHRFLSKNNHEITEIAELINEVILTKEKDIDFENTGAQIAEQVGAISVSREMKNIYMLVAKARSCPNKTVHILGPTGVGKEMVAQSIGRLDSADGPFIPVNCAAIPESLIEGELFGYKKGAFSGALKDYKGKFLEANNGTIFLDEVACLSQVAQQKLLRVLQERTVTPLGSSDDIRLNIRVVSATNVNLDELVTKEL